jgi:uncharacterized protein (DUF486 family)
MNLGSLPFPLQTFGLLALSKMFMTFARYGHLRTMARKAVFVPFAVGCMQQPLKWEYLWAALCLVGGVHFIFRA